MVPSPLALARPWQGLARLAWLGLLVVGLALVAFSLPVQYQQFQTICAGAACDSRQFSPAQAAELSRLGLSLPLVAAYFTALSLLQGLAFIGVGAAIFWRKSADRLALFMSFALVAFGLGGLVNGSSHLPGAVQFLTLCLQALGNSSIVVFLFIFPDGHFFPSWTRWLALLAIAREVLGIFFPNGLFDSLFFVVAAGVLTLQVYRYRRTSNAIQRQQTKWVVFGTLLGIGLYAGLLVFFATLAGQGFQFSAPAAILLNTGVGLALGFIPLSLGMAILRYRLWDIDILIRRTLVYSLLTGLLAAVYFASVVVLQSVLTALTGATRSELVTVLSTLAIAALFVPLRGRLQGFIDRRFFRGKYDSAKTLAQFSATLRDEVELSRLSERLEDVVQQTMEPETVALWLARPAPQLVADTLPGRFPIRRP